MMMYKFEKEVPDKVNNNNEEDDEMQGDDKGLLKLNVGGEKFVTTYATIRNVQNTMLSAMFSGEYKCLKDEDGNFFIDRDGRHFRHVLNLLRFPHDFDLCLSAGDLMELEREIEYYGLIETYNAARVVKVPSVSATSCGYDTCYTPLPPNFKACFTIGEKSYDASVRGWSLLCFNIVTGEVISQSSHDTWGDRHSVQRFISEVQSIPVGTGVAMAVFDEGAQHTMSSPQFLCELRSCGGSGRLIGDRSAFAMVGRKGGLPSTAYEAYDATGASVTATSDRLFVPKWHSPCFDNFSPSGPSFNSAMIAR